MRRRFWLESALAIATAILAVVTSMWPEWIEAIFGADPDGGSGAAEWAVVGIPAIITLAFAAAAGREWRRARLATGGHRLAHAGTWNWSAWRAELQ